MQKCIFVLLMRGGFLKNTSTWTLVSATRMDMPKKHLASYGAISIKAQCSGTSVERTRALVSNLRELQRLINQFER